MAHYMIGIMAVGTALLILVRGKLNLKNEDPVGRILLSAALGLVYNTLQFSVIVVAHHYRLLSQPVMVMIKYGFDLLFLTAVFIKYRKEYGEELRDYIDACLKRENLPILVLSIGAGLIAILNYPHVFDSGQLMQTNLMVTEGWDFLKTNRFGIGFSALGYFPTVLFNDLPLCSIFPGFKLFLLGLTGLMVIYGIDRLDVTYRGSSKVLYFFIVMGSIFGLYGAVELGKDSIWALLFGFIYIFSLSWAGKKGSISIPASVLFFICSISLGMIAIPYILFFTGIFLMVKYLPRRLTGSKVLYMTVIAVLFFIGTRLMPVKLPIGSTLPMVKAGRSIYSFRAPTDGRISFYSYIAQYERHSTSNKESRVIYKNVGFTIVIGLLGVILLPFFKDRFFKDRFSNVGVKSTGLFLLAAPAAFLSLTLPAKNWLPAGHEDKIPFTPFSSFNAWNLIKDLPQWCIQVIAGIFFILLLEFLVIKLFPKPRLRRNVYKAAVCMVIFSIIFIHYPVIEKYRHTAYFNRYGGSKNPHFAKILDTLYTYPEIKNVKVTLKLKTINFFSMYWDLQHYFPRFDSGVMPPLNETTIRELKNDLPFILVSNQEYAAELIGILDSEAESLEKYPLIEDNNWDEGVYLFTGEKIDR